MGARPVISFVLAVALALVAAGCMNDLNTPEYCGDCQPALYTSAPFEATNGVDAPEPPRDEPDPASFRANPPDAPVDATNPQGERLPEAAPTDTTAEPRVQEPPAEVPVDACVPDCKGRTCGSDGCGGHCGTCAVGDVCVVGDCKAEGDACGALTYEGCCAGSGAVVFCDPGKGVAIRGCESSCGWQASAGFYECEEHEPEPSGKHPISCDPASDPK